MLSLLCEDSYAIKLLQKKGRLELFRKFIRFGVASHPLRVQLKILMVLYTTSVFQTTKVFQASSAFSELPSWLYHGGKYDISCGGGFPFSFLERKFTDIALVMQGCGGRGEGANEGFGESENLRVALGRVCKL